MSYRPKRSKHSGSIWLTPDISSLVEVVSLGKHGLDHMVIKLNPLAGNDQPYHGFCGTDVGVGNTQQIKSMTRETKIVHARHHLWAKNKTRVDSFEILLHPTGETIKNMAPQYEALPQLAVRMCSTSSFRSYIRTFDSVHDHGYRQNRNQICKRFLKEIIIVVNDPRWTYFSAPSRLGLRVWVSQCASSFKHQEPRSLTLSIMIPRFRYQIFIKKYHANGNDIKCKIDRSNHCDRRKEYAFFNATRSLHGGSWVRTCDVSASRCRWFREEATRPWSSFNRDTSAIEGSRERCAPWAIVLWLAAGESIQRQSWICLKSRFQATPDCNDHLGGLSFRFWVESESFASVVCFRCLTTSGGLGIRTANVAYLSW